MSSTIPTPPVVFLVFNRPDLTARVFEAIRAARPRTLLVVADGPRTDRPEDIEKCRAVRAIIDTLDWPCEVLKNCSDTNLGCGRRVSSGITWAFEQVEEAIILEDDCLPHPTFFPYCAELLERYRDDERVMHIAGSNFQRGRRRTPYSYFFSRYVHVWGWATWRRAWRLYDYEMRSWPEFKSQACLDSVCSSADERRYWEMVFDRTYSREKSTWDYQWAFCVWTAGALAAYPERNLVSNTGCGSNGTHVTRDTPMANLPLAAMEPIEHPPFLVAHRPADKFTFRHCFRPGILARVQEWAGAVMC